MKTRWLYTLAAIGSCSFALGQQTPPIQPKTVDTGQVPPLTLAGPPKPDEHIANAPLTVDEAVRIALAYQPQITISKSAADALHGQTIQTQAALNPTVAVTASGTRSQVLNNGGGGGANSANVGPFAQYTGQIALNQLIFDFNRTRDQVRQAQALELAGYRTFDQTQQDVILLVKQDFYAYVQAKAQVDVDTANVKSRQAQVDLTQAQVNAGIGEPADLVSAKTLLDQGQIQLIQANLALVTAAVTLTQEMGVDPRTPINVVSPTEDDSTLPDSNALVDQALKQRPEILSAEATLKAAGYGVSVARKTDAPSISFSAGVATGGTNDPFTSQASFVTLSLSWTLIDGGLMRGAVKTAEAQKSSAAANLLLTSQSIVSDVSKAYIGVKAATQQIPVAKAEVANAQEGVRLAEGSYRAGVATFQAIITAQANLVTAQTDQVNAIASLAIARATLDHAIGNAAKK